MNAIDNYSSISSHHIHLVFETYSRACQGLSLVNFHPVLALHIVRSFSAGAFPGAYTGQTLLNCFGDSGDPYASERT